MILISSLLDRITKLKYCKSSNHIKIDNPDYLISMIFDRPPILYLCMQLPSFILGSTQKERLLILDKKEESNDGCEKRCNVIGTEESTKSLSNAVSKQVARRLAA